MAKDFAGQSLIVSKKIVEACCGAQLEAPAPLLPGNFTLSIGITDQTPVTLSFQCAGYITVTNTAVTPNIIYQTIPFSNGYSGAITPPVGANRIRVYTYSCPLNNVTVAGSSVSLVSTSINTSDGIIGTLDVTGCPNVIYVNPQYLGTGIIGGGKLRTVLLPSTSPTILQQLALYGTGVNSVQIQGRAAVPLGTVNVNNFTALTYLGTDYTDLTSINVTGCTSLNTLTYEYTNIVSVNAAALPALGSIYSGYCPLLTSANFSGCGLLNYIDISSSPLLSSLSLTGCTSLTFIDGLQGSGLITLDVSSCTALYTLILDDSSLLTTINASGCSTLALLGIDNCNAVQTINISGCAVLGSNTVPPSLATLAVSNRPALTTLNATGCMTLQLIDANSCPALTTLTITGCSGLQNLNIDSCSTLSTVTAGGCGLLKNIFSTGTAFTQTTADTLAGVLISNNVPNSGTWNLFGQGVTYSGVPNSNLNTLHNPPRSWNLLGVGA
jgi:hypothetical protein